MSKRSCLSRSRPGRGVALLHLDRLPEVLEAAERVLELDPASAEASACQGRTLRVIQRYDEALAAFERALALNPTESEALRGKILTLLHLQRQEDALSCCEEALAFKPDWARAHTSKGGRESAQAAGRSRAHLAMPGGSREPPGEGGLVDVIAFSGAPVNLPPRERGANETRRSILAQERSRHPPLPDDVR